MLFRLALVALCGGFPLAAMAQHAPNARELNSETIQDEIYGVILEGTTGFDEYWTECIDLNGDTIYYFAGEVKRGKMKLYDPGVMCFAYDEADAETDNCFTARRLGSDQYVFEPANGLGNPFRTTRVIRNVDVCPEEAPALS